MGRPAIAARWFSRICAILLVLCPAHGSPQANQPLPAVGILTLSAGPDETIIESFRNGLRRFGYFDGQSIHIEHKYAQGHAERLPQLARELADFKVKAIVTGGGPQVQAALGATTDIPIVIVVHEADPAASKLIESYRRPGGNVTGIYARELEAVGKRLELLREMFPQLKHIAALWDRYSRFKLEELKSSAQSMGIALHPIEVNAPYDFDSAFKSAKAMRADAVLVLLTYAFYVRREQLAAAALRAKLPTMHDKEDMVKAGGLVSYGASFDDTWGRAAYFVDRILKGAKPSELPVEQVSTFRLVINERTARVLGVSFPQSTLVRADEVIR
jgi:putative ABC transport system substrate-binding protein